MAMLTPEERVERFLQNANDAASHVQTVYLLFLLTSTYLAITIGSTTDEQLLKISNVTLPLLNVGIPILAFYILAPWLTLLLHFNLLLQLYLLATKLHTLDTAIATLKPEGVQDEQRKRLYPFPFSHRLIGHHHGRLVRALFSLVVCISIILLPLLLLLGAQIRFLPYHSEPITFSQQVAVALDVLLLWILWPRIVESRGKMWAWWRQVVTPILRGRLQTARPGSAMGVFALIVIAPALLVFSLGIAVVPDKKIDSSLFRYNLHLAEGVFVAGEPSAEVVAALQSNKEEEQVQAWKKVMGLNLAGRDLRFANFSRAILPRANLQEAQLQSADLQDARLQSANLRKAKLQDTNLWRARLQGAHLWKTQFQGAELQKAQFQGADLTEAQFQGADLTEAKLRGADLGRACLQGANLKDAQLQGANLRGTDLRGAIFQGAQLQGADLRDTRLQGADLRGASIGSVAFSGAVLDWGALLALERKPFTHLEYYELRDLLSQAMANEEKREETFTFLREQIGRPDNLETVSIREVLCDTSIRLTNDGCFFEAQLSLYEEKLTDFLIRLSCTDSYIARGIARRADKNFDSGSPQFKARLASALLHSRCQGHVELPQEVKDRLKEVIEQNAKEEAK